MEAHHGSHSGSISYELLKQINGRLKKNKVQHLALALMEPAIIIIIIIIIKQENDYSDVRQL